jgi:hypothetical protein
LQADRVYLRILKLAADGSESEVAMALEQLLATATAWDERSVAAKLSRALPALPTLLPGTVNLSDYDQLLGREVNDVAA